MVHIQNLTAAANLEHHWGYVDRALPCTSDAGSCAYLDVVYHSHDLGILYSAILWGTILGILLVWGVGRQIHRHEQSKSSNQGGGLSRVGRSFRSYIRRYLLPEAARPIFGRTTRLQILILAVLAGYIAVWSFVGIVYKTWITPVKKSPGLYNTRSSIGPFADRIGILAYALTPLSVMLSSRESLLSLITGVPYQHFNFLHRWLGYIIFVQASVHTIGWSLVEFRFYQPQPTVGVEFIKETYVIWGVVAMLLLMLLVGLSTPWAIRRTGYEFFRKAHYVLAMLYVGACWGHWAQLKCWMIASLIVWFLDRGVRLFKTALVHRWYYSGVVVGFKNAEVVITRFADKCNGDIVRLDFQHPQGDWKIGQHFFLCFPELSIWQSHPFTPCSLPHRSSAGLTHSYIFRAKQGETKKVAALVDKASAATSEEKIGLIRNTTTTPVILSGPCGGSIMDGLNPDTNVLCIAGGTGITYVLPVLLSLMQDGQSGSRRMSLIWAIRRSSDQEWIREELEAFSCAAKRMSLTVHIFVTREEVAEEAGIAGLDVSNLGPEKTSGPLSASAAVSSSAESTHSQHHTKHPNLGQVVSDFVNDTVQGSTTVFASGPGGMISDLRTAVASCNDGAKVWKGRERFDVNLVCDDRLEW